MTLNKILENFVWDIVCDTIVSVLTVLLAEVSLQMFSTFFKIKCPLDGFLCSRMIWAWSRIILNRCKLRKAINFFLRETKF